MSDADRLIGRWRLVDYTLSFEEGDSVQPIGARPFGLLIYTPDSGVSAASLRTGPSSTASRPLLVSSVI